MSKQEERKSIFKNPNVWIGGSAAIILLFIIGIVIYSGSQNATSSVDEVFSDSSANSERSASSYDFVSRPLLLTGHEEAPITITIFEDFHCSSCAYLSLVSMDEIEKRFVQTGQANVEFRHFVHYGDDSLAAAMAAECVYEQDVEFGTQKFKRFHDLLFENQQDDFEPRLRQYASQVGVRDLDGFESCVESNRYAQKVRESTNWIMQQGAQGTPAVIVGDQIFVGVPAIDAIERSIELKLQRESYLPTLES